MEVVVVDDANAVAKIAAERITRVITEKPYAVLGLATGSSPLLTYATLIEKYRQNEISFEHVTSFNLDEYIGIAQNNPQSYRYFMDKHLFSNINILPENTYLPVCKVKERPEQIGACYEKAIENAGGIDIQLLGIGANGHIGFNEPVSSLSSRTRVKTLTEQTINDNARLFAYDEYQPHLAMTMGIGTIMDSKRVVLIATGKKKASAIKAAIEGPISAMHPASVLQMHQHTSFIIDESAASELAHVKYYKWCFAEDQKLKKP